MGAEVLQPYCPSLCNFMSMYCEPVTAEARPLYSILFANMSTMNNMPR